MNSTNNNTTNPALPILAREAAFKNGDVERDAITVEFIDLSCSERARIWVHNHPVTAIIAAIAFTAFLSGTFFAITASMGLPLLGGALLALAKASLISFVCVDHFFPRATVQSKLYDPTREEQGHYSIDAVLELKDFKLVAVILGPVRFREKLEAELLQEKYPFVAYSRIMARLKEMGGREAFFGPLPKFKEYFLSKTQGLRCSEFFSKKFFRHEEKENNAEIIDSKETIFYLQKSALISTEEASCLMSAYEIISRFDWLSDRLRNFSAPRCYLEPNGLREECSQISEEALVQSREKRDADLAAVDAAFESVRTKPL